MMKSLPLWLLPALLIGSVGLWLAWSPPSADTAPATESVAQTPRYSVSGARWLRLDAQGQAQLRMQAQRIDYYADDSAVLVGLQVDAIGGLASPWRLTAPSGLMPAGSRRLRLDGPVAGLGDLEKDEPAKLSAGTLWLDQSKRLISSERPVRIETPRRQAQAQGFSADFDGQWIELRGKVEARYAPSA